MNRRVPTQDELESEIEAIVKERNDKQIEIKWQFSIDNARNTMNSKYKSINRVNEKYIVT